jgi:hypothetical protein
MVDDFAAESLNRTEFYLFQAKACGKTLASGK